MTATHRHGDEIDDAGEVSLAPDGQLEHRRHRLEVRLRTEIRTEYGTEQWIKHCQGGVLGKGGVDRGGGVEQGKRAQDALATSSQAGAPYREKWEIIDKKREN